MLSVCGRRRFRQCFVKFFIALAVFLVISFLKRSDPKPTATAKRTASPARLFCILLSTHSTHELFVYMSNKTWAKQCHQTGLVRYRRTQNPDNEVNIPKSPYHVDIWTRILETIRQSITSYDFIYDDDLLVIVPAPTFVFRKKLFSLMHSFPNHSQSPLIIIHEHQEANAYIVNGKALDLLRNTETIDLCLKKSYPSAREKHLWKCVQTSGLNEQTDAKCDRNNCFIRYQHDQLTAAHIKNGFCLEKTLPMCQTIALLFPVTISDFITLEFFKYRLQSKPSIDTSIDSRARTILLKDTKSLKES